MWLMIVSVLVLGKQLKGQEMDWNVFQKDKNLKQIQEIEYKNSKNFKAWGNNIKHRPFYMNH